MHKTSLKVSSSRDGPQLDLGPDSQRGALYDAPGFALGAADRARAMRLPSGGRRFLVVAVLLAVSMAIVCSLTFLHYPVLDRGTSIVLEADTNDYVHLLLDSRWRWFFDPTAQASLAWEEQRKVLHHVAYFPVAEGVTRVLTRLAAPAEGMTDGNLECLLDHPQARLEVLPRAIAPSRATPVLSARLPGGEESGLTSSSARCPCRTRWLRAIVPTAGARQGARNPRRGRQTCLALPSGFETLELHLQIPDCLKRNDLNRPRQPTVLQTIDMDPGTHQSDAVMTIGKRQWMMPQVNTFHSGLWKYLLPITEDASVLYLGTKVNGAVSIAADIKAVHYVCYGARHRAEIEGQILESGRSLRTVELDTRGRLPYPDTFFDGLVVCDAGEVTESLSARMKGATQLFGELFRVLKSDGFCYMSLRKRNLKDVMQMQQPPTLSLSFLKRRLAGRRSEVLRLVDDVDGAGLRAILREADCRSTWGKIRFRLGAALKARAIAVVAKEQGRDLGSINFWKLCGAHRSPNIRPGAASISVPATFTAS